MKLWIKRLIIISLVIAFAKLASLYPLSMDWTANSRHSLTQQSKNIIDTLTDKVTITAYVKEDKAFRKKLTQLIQRYRDYKADFQLNFINPKNQVDKLRKLNIKNSESVIIHYQNRSETLKIVSETTITNSLLKLSSHQSYWISFLIGHQERSIIHSANHDLSLFSQHLQQHNIQAQSLNLAQINAIPDNSALLVIAEPQSALLATEIEIILNYIEQGGNLLWLTSNNHHLDILEQQLGIKRLSGRVVDGNSKLYGLTDPSYVVSNDYASHPITENFNTVSVFPSITALVREEFSDYQITALINSSQQSWTEIGEINGKIAFDNPSQEQRGPLVLALAMTKNRTNKQQRIVIIGDGDFLSNSFLGNVGNQELGLRTLKWLLHSDQQIPISTLPVHDQNIQLSHATINIIAYGFMIMLPLLLFITGLWIHYRRNKA